MLSRPSQHSEAFFEDGMNAAFDAEDAEAATTWVATARDCKCCQGYIYGCKEPICKSLGECVCQQDGE